MNTTPVHLDFVSLQTTDRPRSASFYRDLLGFALSQQPNPVADVYEDAGGASFAVRDPLAPLPPDGPLGVGVGLWFAVGESVDALHQRLVAAGTRVLKAPYDTPFGRAVTVADPDGYAVTLHEKTSRS